jgi:hypothetical protein
VNNSSIHAGHSLPVPGIEPGFLGSPVHSPVINRLNHRRSRFRSLIQVIVELINLLSIIHSPSPRLAATHVSDHTDKQQLVVAWTSFCVRTCRSADAHHSSAVPTDHDRAPYRPQTPATVLLFLQTTIQHPTGPSPLSSFLRLHNCPSINLQFVTIFVTGRYLQRRHFVQTERTRSELLARGESLHN